MASGRLCGLSSAGGPGGFHDSPASVPGGRTAPGEAEILNLAVDPRSNGAASLPPFWKLWALKHRELFFSKSLRQIPQPSPSTGGTVGSRLAFVPDITNTEP